MAEIENEIAERARQLLERHGSKAGHVAALRVSNFVQRGDQGAAEVWRKVRAAVQGGDCEHEQKSEIQKL